MPPVGVYASVQQTVAGLTVTATGVGGSVTVYDFSFVPMPGWGTHSLIGGDAATTGWLPLRLDFSTALSGLSIEFGNPDPHDKGIVTLDAYSTGGTLLDHQTFNHGTQTGVRTIAVAGPGIAYVVGQSSDVLFPNAIAWDNLTATVVPEPVSLMAICAGASALALRRKRSGKLSET